MRNSCTASLKKVQTGITNAVKDDGEIYEAKKETLVFIKGKEVFSMWFDTLHPIIKKITRLTDFKLLYWISTNIKYDEGKICLNKHFKEEIEEDMGISQASINRGIAFFKSSNILIPVAKKNRSAIFFVHPCYLWRGGKHERQKMQNSILRMLRTNNLPEAEKKVVQDIERYETAMQNEYNCFDFSKVTAA